ncbi:hypothetical protein [Microvirga sp. M2]|uniref:hypothetical protein n=1 Tax=Microvirga sp. M2 TaxID=3073270 RepID=UPI0039C3E2E8
MRRQIIGLLVASAMAPYAMVFIVLGLEPVLQIDLLSIELTGPLDLYKFVLLATVVAASLGPLIALLAGLVVWGLNALGWKTPWVIVLSGSLFGLCVNGALFGGLALSSAPQLAAYACYVAAGTLAGAICGWIYWRIAIRRTPEAGHAIAEP